MYTHTMHTHLGLFHSKMEPERNVSICPLLPLACALLGQPPKPVRMVEQSKYDPKYATRCYSNLRTQLFLHEKSRNGNAYTLFIGGIFSFARIARTNRLETRMPRRTILVKDSDPKARMKVPLCSVSLKGSGVLIITVTFVLSVVLSWRERVSEGRTESGNRANRVTNEVRHQSTEPLKGCLGSQKLPSPPLLLLRLICKQGQKITGWKPKPTFGLGCLQHSTQI